MSSKKFNTGGAAAEEAAKASRASGNRSRAAFFSLSDGEETFVRFLDESDDWIWIKQHNFVPTKGAPSDATDDQKKNFPTKMGAVCRYDDAFRDDYHDCFICDQMTNDKGKKFFPQIRLWARVVMRVPVVGTQEMVEAGQIGEHQVGKRVGFRDGEVEEDDLNDAGQPTGKKVQKKDVRVVNMPMKNFFGHFQGYYDAYGTVLDRDYRIKRIGAGLETEYKIAPMDPIPGHDLSDPELQARYEGLVNIEKIIEERASDEFYARFFDTRVAAPARKAQGGEGAEAPAAAPVAAEEDTVSKDKLDAMKARVRGGTASATASGPQNF